MMSSQVLTATQLELLRKLSSGANRSNFTEDLIDLVLLGLVRETTAGWELIQWGYRLLIERDNLAPPLNARPSA